MTRCKESDKDGRQIQWQQTGSYCSASCIVANKRTIWWCRSLRWGPRDEESPCFGHGRNLGFGFVSRCSKRDCNYKMLSLSASWIRFYGCRSNYWLKFA